MELELSQIVRKLDVGKLEFLQKFVHTHKVRKVNQNTMEVAKHKWFSQSIKNVPIILQ